MDARVPVDTAPGKNRAGRLHDALAAHVASGDMPGVVALVSRRGETRVEAIGTQSFGSTPMRRDTIFRIASMTKPITAAATLILVEECRLRLDDPVVGPIRSVCIGLGQDLSTSYFLTRPLEFLDHGRQLIPFLIRQPNDILLVHGKPPCFPHHPRSDGISQPQLLAVTEH